MVVTGINPDSASPGSLVIISLAPSVVGGVPPNPRDCHVTFPAVGGRAVAPIVSSTFNGVGGVATLIVRVPGDAVTGLVDVVELPSRHKSSSPFTVS